MPVTYVDAGLLGLRKAFENMEVFFVELKESLEFWENVTPLEMSCTLNVFC